MQHRPEITRDAIADHLPPSAVAAARDAARSLAAALLRIWLLFAPATLIADAAFEPAWPAQLLITVGVVLSGITFARSRSRPRRRRPVANLSAASSCVWKMDIEG